MPDVTELAKRLRDCAACRGTGKILDPSQAVSIGADVTPFQDYRWVSCSLCATERRAADELERLDGAANELSELHSCLDQYGIPGGGKGWEENKHASNRVGQYIRSQELKLAEAVGLLRDLMNVEDWSEPRKRERQIKLWEFLARIDVAETENKKC